MKPKPKKTFDEIYELLISKGITFKSHSKKQVMELLKHRNYYYRVASYRKNFFKDRKTKKYINCDFEHLVDLASIDVYLREFLLSLCLDVEHATKTELMKVFTMNTNEDGYTFVEDFFEMYPGDRANIKSSFSKTKYLSDMYSKRQNISIWVLLEIVNFGQLLKIIEFYNSRNNNKMIDSLDKNLKYIKNIRNACAHNNIFIINLYDNSLIIERPSASVVSIASSMSIGRDIIKYAKLHDLMILFYYHMKYCSKRLNYRRYNEGIRVLNRMRKNYSIYDQLMPINGFFKYYGILLDNFKAVE